MGCVVVLDAVKGAPPVFFANFIADEMAVSVHCGNRGGARPHTIIQNDFARLGVSLDEVGKKIDGLLCRVPAGAIRLVVEYVRRVVSPLLRVRVGRIPRV